MNIYFNGCSHSTGDGLFKYGGSYGYIVGASIFGIDNYKDIHYKSNFEDYYKNNKNINESNYWIEDNFKKLIFDKIENNKNHVINHSHSGKSNDKIFYETVNVLYESIQLNKSIDLFIVQWSGPNRRIHTLPSLENNTTRAYNVTPFDFVEHGLKFEPFASNQTLQYMLLLQDLFKKYNKNYVFIPYMELDSNSLKLSNIISLLDTTKITTDIKIGHRNEIRKKGFFIDRAGHASELGHYYLAYKVLKTLNLHDSIIGYFDYFKHLKISNIASNNVNDYQRKKIKKNYNKLGNGITDLI